MRGSALLFAVLVISASPSAQATARAQGVELVIRRERLPNGLRVVMQEDHSAPSVTVCVTYDVGARNERSGQAGFAHLFEQMMFEGSRNVPRGDHFRLITARGGTATSMTTTERTSYVDTLPSGDLALGLWLEADRMKTLALTERKLEAQRAIVQDEYRTRISNTAYAFGALRLRELAFQGFAPYEHAAIGSPEDIDGAAVDWVRQFHEDYYAPNNAVLTLTGDFAPQAALGLVTEYFGDAAPQPNVPPLTSSAPPRQTSERLSVVEDTNARTPGIYYGWVVPPARTSQHDALRIATALLADGEGSELHQSLVRDKEVASEVTAEIGANRGPGLMSIRILVAGHSTIDQAQKLFESEIRKLQVVGPTEAALQRAKEIVRSRFLMSLQSSADRAVLLGDDELLWGDATVANAELARIDAITSKDVRQVAAMFLSDSHRSSVEVYPPGWIKDEYPAVLTRTHIVRKGETLIGIAKQYNVDVRDILTANKMRRVGVIHPGEKLVIPRSGRPRAGTTKNSTTQPPAKNAAAPVFRSYVVKKGDTLAKIARRFGVTASSIAAHNQLGPKQRIVVGQKLLIPASETRK